MEKADSDPAFRAKLVNYLNKHGGTEYAVVDCIKVGRVVMHVLDKELPDADSYKGAHVRGVVDKARRAQLQAHHTGTHLIFASCRKVLGPHVWQAGAKKTTDQAHLDVTHYKSLTAQEEQEIENMANRLINDCVDVEKGFMDKSEAEKLHGFSLY
jgi:alanyl-tRNA synthetase